MFQNVINRSIFSTESPMRCASLMTSDGAAGLRLPWRQPWDGLLIRDWSQQPILPIRKPFRQQLNPHQSPVLAGSFNPKSPHHLASNSAANRLAPNGRPLWVSLITAYAPGCTDAG